MKHLFKRLLVEESGMEMLEWAVVAVLFAVAAATAFTTLGGVVSQQVTDAADVFNGAGTP